MVYNDRIQGYRIELCIVIAQYQNQSCDENDFGGFILGKKKYARLEYSGDHLVRRVIVFSHVNGIQLFYCLVDLFEQSPEISILLKIIDAFG